MPRDESDREDLLSEATALAERVAIRLWDRDDEIVIGFRRDDSASFYFGADPVYQFTSAGKLRRAFVDGLLYKAHGGQLIALRRERAEHAVHLVRRELTAEDMQEFLRSMARNFDALRERLATGAFELAGEVPSGAEVLSRVRRWLDCFAQSGTIADSPGAR